MKIIETRSLLGEGLAYLPQLGRVIAFDILNRKAYLLNPLKDWALEVIDLPFRGSCAMETTDGDVLIAGDHAIYRTTNFKSFENILQHDFDEDMRMNDGQADPMGRFWYSSMAMNGDRPCGAIYCYEPLSKSNRKVFEGLTIPNALCFDVGQNRGYFADSKSGLVFAFDYMNSLPSLQLFLDLSSQPFVPDGAIVDDEGCFWNAQWGGSRVAKYSQEGKEISTINLPISQVSCPLIYNGQLVVTSARIGLSKTMLKSQPEAGNIFIIPI